MAPPSPIPEAAGRLDGVTMWPYSNLGVSGGRQEVVEERGGERIAGVVDEFFVSTPPMPCTTPPAICPSTTIGLMTIAAVFAHDVAIIVTSPVFGRFRRADVRAVRERGALSGAVAIEPGRDSGAGSSRLAGVRAARSRERAPRPRRAAQRIITVLDSSRSSTARFIEVRGDLEHAGAHLQCGLAHRVATEDRVAAPTGCRAIGETSVSPCNTVLSMSTPRALWRQPGPALGLDAAPASSRR